MADDELSMEVAPGHTITGKSRQVEHRNVGSGTTVMLTVWTYECSCGQLYMADTDMAQEHAEDVTP